MPSSFVKRIRVMLRDYDYIPVRPRRPAPNVLFKRSEPVGLSVDRIWKSRFFAATYVVGRGRGRTFFLLRLRASADFSFAFCPGGMKNACFFASLMISSVITLRLKRRSALSIDSPGLTLTTAIYLSLPSKYLSEPLFNTFTSPLVKQTSETPRALCASLS